MKIKDVINAILAYHPQFPADYAGCDDYKSGNPEDECTGIVTAIVPTIEVIKKTHELGANLLVVHEPTYYTSQDLGGWGYDFTNQVYEEKAALLKEYGITIWRDHDHMHAHQPDGIFTGVFKYMGWEPYYDASDRAVPFAFVLNLPESTVGETADVIKEKMGCNSLRYIGNDDARIKKVALVFHLTPNGMGSDFTDEKGLLHEYSLQVIEAMEHKGVDAIIPGEVIDWTVMSYIRDAAQLGKNKAAFVPGHFSWEELGMKYAADWIGDLVKHELPVTFVNAGDMYKYR